MMTSQAGFSHVYVSPVLAHYNGNSYDAKLTLLEDLKK